MVLLAAYWLVRKVEKAAPSSTPAVAGVYTCPAQVSVAAWGVFQYPQCNLFCKAQDRQQAKATATDKDQVFLHASQPAIWGENGSQVDLSSSGAFEMCLGCHT